MQGGPGPTEFEPQQVRVPKSISFSGVYLATLSEPNIVTSESCNTITVTLDTVKLILVPGIGSALLGLASRDRSCWLRQVTTYWNIHSVGCCVERPFESHICGSVQHSRRQWRQVTTESSHNARNGVTHRILKSGPTRPNKPSWRVGGAYCRVCIHGAGDVDS